MIEPGRATGTLFASADGEAIGGKEGAMPSVRSFGCSSAGGVAVSVATRLAPGLFGVGEGVASGFFTSSVFPFSSSASLPTSFEVVKPTSFNAAKTDAPRTVITVPPFEANSFNVETPPEPNSDIYRLADPSGKIRTL